MAQVRKSITIKTPVSQVYALARDPRQWHVWWTGLSAPEEIKGHGEPGTVVKHHYAMAGMAFPLTSRVTADEISPADAHWHAEIEGPIAGWHDWKLKAHDDCETEVSMELEYSIPGKLLGRFADRLIIERIEDRAMGDTIQNLKLLCEGRCAATAAHLPGGGPVGGQ